MFSLFRKKRILSLDISRSGIRYIVLEKRMTRDVLVSYGKENLPTLEAHNALLLALLDIRRKTKMSNIIVCLPPESIHSVVVRIPSLVRGEKIERALAEEMLQTGTCGEFDEILSFEEIEAINQDTYYKVLVVSKENTFFLKSLFQNAGFRVRKFFTKGDAITAPLRGAQEPFLALFVDDVGAVLVRQEPLMLPVEFFVPTIHVSIIGGALRDVAEEYYKETKQSIKKVILSGNHTLAPTFLNDLIRESRMQVLQTNTIASVTPSGKIPLIPKHEACEYEVALGAAIRYNTSI